MFESYKLIEDGETYEIYQFNPITRYWICLSIVLMLLYDFMESNVIPLLGVVLLVAYFVLCFFPSRKNLAIIKTAMKRGTIELSGSIWSFSNPQKVKVLKAMGADT